MTSPPWRRSRARAMMPPCPAALAVAVAVARRAQLDGVAAEALPEDDAALTARVRQSAWQAKYLPAVRVATSRPNADSGRETIRAAYVCP